MMMNRNKRGIALDLKTAGGRRALAPAARGRRRAGRELPAGTMARLGLDYEELRRATRA